MWMSILSLSVQLAAQRRNDGHDTTTGRSSSTVTGESETHRSTDSDADVQTVVMHAETNRSCGLRGYTIAY